MPGPIAHLYAAQTMSELLQVADARFTGSLFYGAVAPDMGYFPGSDPLWSDLPHYIGSVTFARRITDLSETPGWQAFSKGWLLHLTLDVSAHPVINRFAADHYSKSDDHRSVLTYEDNPTSHAKIETGLDLAVLRELRSFRQLKVLSSPFITDRCPLVRAYRDCYAQAIPVDKLRKAAKRYPRLLAGGVQCQAYLNGWGQPEAVASRLSSPVTDALSLLLKRPLGDHRAGIISGLLHPDQPTREEYDTYVQAIRTGIRVCIEIITGDRPWPEYDYNLDTGEIAKQDEYGMSDRLMSFLIEANSPEQIRSRFGEDADNILRLWEGIRTGFERGG